jgi:hypothetical protein
MADFSQLRLVTFDIEVGVGEAGNGEKKAREISNRESVL